MALSVIYQSSTVSRPASASRRSAVVVNASAESRRAVLSGFLAGAALAVSGAAKAASTPVDIIDDRKVIDDGYMAIYEARDDALPENQRLGRSQARADVASIKAQLQVIKNRIDASLEPLIKKNYWAKAREELRLQVGYVRFDLKTLAESKNKEEKAKALALRKDFINQVEALDFALRKKDELKATSLLATTRTALDTVLASVL